MNVLITGGAGFIGSHIAEHFQGEAKVAVLDNFRSGHKKNLDDLDVSLTEGSILDRDCVRSCMVGVDYVFHLAAMVSVPESVEDPAGCEELNLAGLNTVLEEAASAGVKKLVFSSSAAVYGSDPTVPKRETMGPRPLSPYAETKLAGEVLCQEFSKAGKLGTASLRYFNVFGPRQDPQSAYAAAVPIFIQQALANETLTIHGDGEQTRDFVYVKDVVSANAFAALHEDVRTVYNVGYGKRLSIKQLAEMILALTGSKSQIKFTDERAGDVKHSMAAVGKLIKAGWQPASSLESGLKEMLGDYPGI